MLNLACAGKHAADLAAAEAKRSSEHDHHLQQLAHVEGQHKDLMLELQSHVEDARQCGSVDHGTIHTACSVLI